jgi:hypothetical protein
MKKEHLQKEPSPDEAAELAYEDAPEPETREGRSGEGAHSAMKHWLHEERNRLKRPEH